MRGAGELTMGGRAVQARPSPASRILLYAIVLAVCWSPRIRLDFLPGETVDLRLQDGLIVVALTYLLLAPAPPVPPRWDLAWGKWLRAFALTAALTTLLHMLIAQPVSDPIRVAYLGRIIEIFLLAIAVCGLYLRAGIDHRSMGRVLRLGVWANLLWIAAQTVTGTRSTLFGEVGDLIGSYGPKLIGEPSAFGSGFFLTFAAALTVADYRAGTLRRPVAIATFAAIIPAAYFVESRVNLFIIVGLIAFLARRQARALVNPVVVTFAGLGALAAIMLWGDQLVGRLSVESLTRGIVVRFDIWRLMGQYAGDWAPMGIGPGGLAAPGLAWDEAHNIIVRAWLDFGVIGAVLFFAVFVLVARAAIRASRPERPVGVRWAGVLAGLTLLGALIAGMVQDSLTAVTSTHLLMVTIGILAAEISKTADTMDRDDTEAEASRTH